MGFYYLKKVDGGYLRKMDGFKIILIGYTYQIITKSLRYAVLATRAITKSLTYVIDPDARTMFTSKSPGTGGWVSPDPTNLSEYKQ